jgi:hypothetical protein
MSWTTANYGYWEFWAPFDPTNGYYGGQKCTFDGLNKIIYVNPDVTELSIREDVYSNWKEWVQVRDNSKFTPAIRTTGGDPVGSGQYTGDVYFLVNGWKLYIDITKVNVTGVLYSDDYNTAYYSLDGAPQFPIKVSSVVNAITTAGGSSGDSISAADVWSYGSRTITQTIPTAPTVVQIRQELDSNSSQLSAIKAKTDTITTAPTVTQIRQEMDTNSTKLQQLVTAIAALPQSTQDIVTAMIAALNATTIPVNIEAVNGLPITGTGTEQDPWGPQ